LYYVLFHFFKTCNAVTLRETLCIYLHGQLILTRYKYTYTPDTPLDEALSNKKLFMSNNGYLMIIDEKSNASIHISENGVVVSTFTFLERTTVICNLDVDLL